MNLNRKVGDMNYDGLISGQVPAEQIDGRTIAKGASETKYVRGTIFARSASTGKLSILGTAATGSDTLTPDCILCDDVTVGTAADVNVAVYTAGCFDPNKVTVKSGYDITQGDLDALRVRSIVLRAKFESQ